MKNKTSEKIISNNLVSVTKKFDATGQLCPQLIVDANREIDTVKIGEVIEIISTDSATKNCVPDWCEYNEHILLDSKFNKNDYKYRYLVLRVKKSC